MNNLTKYWWLAIIKGVLLMLLALYVFRHPVDAIVGIALYVGITLLMTGVLEMVASLSAKDIVPKWGWGLFGGIMDFVFGIILLSNPVLSAATLPFVIGFWIIFAGIITFSNSFSERKRGNTNWWLGLLSGILSIVLGYIITNNEIAGVLAITWWMGIGFFVAGITNVLIGISLNPKNQE